MNGMDHFQTVLARLQLPDEWHLAVAIRPRRRSIGIEVKPGGAVAVLVPPTADPEHVAIFVRSRRRWIAENVDRATSLAPEHQVKEFVDGEAFDLLGQRYHLKLVDTLPAGIERLPAVTPDHVLYVRRQQPEAVRRAIIALYSQVGLTWVKREGRWYEEDGRIEGLRYQVRDLGKRRWGLYSGSPKHVTALHWAVFGLPMHLAEYVLVHEQTHASRPGGRAHGLAWQRRLHSWMPDWQQRQAELAEVGRHCWLGDHKPLQDSILPRS